MKSYNGAQSSFLDFPTTNAQAGVIFNDRRPRVVARLTSDALRPGDHVEQNKQLKQVKAVTPVEVDNPNGGKPLNRFHVEFHDGDTMLATKGKKHTAHVTRGANGLLGDARVNPFLTSSSRVGRRL